MCKKTTNFRLVMFFWCPSVEGHTEFHIERHKLKLTYCMYHVCVYLRSQFWCSGQLHNGEVGFKPTAVSLQKTLLPKMAPQQLCNINVTFKKDKKNKKTYICNRVIHKAKEESCDRGHDQTDTRTRSWTCKDRPRRSTKTHNWGGNYRGIFRREALHGQKG